MSKIKLLFLIFWLNLFVPLSLNAQKTTDRKPYASGRFYEADSAKLVSDIQFLFSKAKAKKISNVLAVISPHAGYVYSGEVAATAINQLDPYKKYKNIFVIGSSHTMRFEGASVYSVGDYITPLGNVVVNTTLASELVASNKNISFVPEAHVNEHILENQLPLLQYHLKQPFQIIPMVIGTDNEKVLKSLAETLKPFLNSDNLFVISADFSHYPVYRDAQIADSATARAILSNEPEIFSDALLKNKRAGMPGLVTSTCGSTAIKTMLYITENQNDLQFIPLQYMNSGDAAIGDKNRVVGYFSLALIKNLSTDSKDFLTEKDKKVLLAIARMTVEEYVNNKEIPDLDKDQFSASLNAHSGAFVTLIKNHKLRGCIGRFTGDKPLYQTVQEMAIAAALNDYRFTPVKASELPSIDFEISVLTPLEKINSIDEIVLGRDGIYIIKDQRSGTFLPQVAEQTGWSKEEFLGHCSRDKAGIGWEGWKDADIYTFQAIVFSEGEIEEE